MWLLSLWSFRLPAPFCFHGLFRRNRCGDPGIVKIRVSVIICFIPLGWSYIHWEKTFNLKTMAKTLIYLQENSLTDLDALDTALADAHGKVKVDEWLAENLGYMIFFRDVGK